MPWRSSSGEACCWCPLASSSPQCPSCCNDPCQVSPCSFLFSWCWVVDFVVLSKVSMQPSTKRCTSLQGETSKLNIVVFAFWHSPCSSGGQPEGNLTHDWMASSSALATALHYNSLQDSKSYRSTAAPHWQAVHCINGLVHELEVFVVEVGFWQTEPARWAAASVAAVDRYHPRPLQ